MKPSNLIRETVLPRYGDVTAFARALRVSRVNTSRLVNGHMRVTVPMALRLEGLGHGSAREWLILQMDWDLEQERKRDDD